MTAIGWAMRRSTFEKTTLLGFQNDRVGSDGNRGSGSMNGTGYVKPVFVELGGDAVLGRTTEGGVRHLCAILTVLRIPDQFGGRAAGFGQVAGVNSSVV